MTRTGYRRTRRPRTRLARSCRSSRIERARKPCRKVARAVAKKLIHPKSPPGLDEAGLPAIGRGNAQRRCASPDRQAQPFNGERLGWFLGLRGLFRLATRGGRYHIAIMNPQFSTVSQGNEWSVQAEWPDGTIEIVAGPFNSNAEALAWLEQSSNAWIEARRR